MTLEEIRNNFMYHAPNAVRAEKHQEIREVLLQAAESVFELCPDSAERTLAIRKLEEAMMWSNAAIARAAEAWV